MGLVCGFLADPGGMENHLVLWENVGVAVPLSDMNHDGTWIAGWTWVRNGLAEFDVEVGVEPDGQFQGQLIRALKLRIGAEFGQVRGNGQILGDFGNELFGADVVHTGIVSR